MTLRDFDRLILELLGETRTLLLRVYTIDVKTFKTRA